LRHKLRVANIRHCRYCIPIHQAAQLSRADPGVSRAFLSTLNALLNPQISPANISDVVSRRYCNVLEETSDARKYLVY